MNSRHDGRKEGEEEKVEVEKKQNKKKRRVSEGREARWDGRGNTVSNTEGIRILYRKGT